LKRIVVLFSGEGRNLHNIIEKLHGKVCEVCCALTNKQDAKGLQNLDAAYGIKSEVLEHGKFDSRESYDTALVAILKKYDSDLVVLAGFMRILTPVFTSQIKAINLHPSLLPKYKGANAIQNSYESGDTQCGVSVHWVSEELDGGEVIAQKSFLRDNAMGLQEFTNKIKALEFELLPEVITEIL
jgi:phosphoribosylglycinamide formyltransferase 1